MSGPRDNKDTYQRDLLSLLLFLWSSLALMCLSIFQKNVKYFWQIFFLVQSGFFQYWQHLQITRYPKTWVSIIFIWISKWTNAQFFGLNATNYKDVKFSLNLMQFKYNLNSIFSSTNYSCMRWTKLSLWTCFRHNNLSNSQSLRYYAKYIWKIINPYVSHVTLFLTETNEN